MYRLFFLMRLRPPLSTLFPYTTLFRSDGCEVGGGLHVERRRGYAERDGARQHGAVPGGRVAGVGLTDVRRVARLQDELARDRKSTRLNSSHRCISYAVFCLKKKTKPQL